jgi:glycerol uptake facilitator-like aquaporin
MDTWNCFQQVDPHQEVQDEFGTHETGSQVLIKNFGRLNFIEFFCSKVFYLTIHMYTRYIESSSNRT